MSSPNSSNQYFIPNDLIIPTNADHARLILTDYLKQIVDSLNLKEFGQYGTVELLTGQTWFTPGNANINRLTYRKVIDFGTLPNTATKSVAHGITTTGNTVFTRIYGTATDPGASSITAAIPLPYVDPNTAANGIQLDIDATNVNVTTAADYTAYSAYIVLEYIQN